MLLSLMNEIMGEYHLEATLKVVGANVSLTATGSRATGGYVNNGTVTQVAVSAKKNVNNKRHSEHSQERPLQSQ